jgi:hypothetical protein
MNGRKLSAGGRSKKSMKMCRTNTKDEENTKDQEISRPSIIRPGVIYQASG